MHSILYTGNYAAITRLKDFGGLLTRLKSLVDGLLFRESTISYYRDYMLFVFIIETPTRYTLNHGCAITNYSVEF